MATYHFSTPLQEEDMRKLHVGDVVYLTGHVFTARDMAHLRIRGLLEEGKPLPKDFAGAAVFHAGPVALKNEDGSWRLNVIGPTTSIRMEPYADVVGRMGVRAVIGKGGMDADTLRACGQYGYVYLQAAPGCAAKLAQGIERINDVTWFELGMPEAVWDLQANEFGPLVVGMDTHGQSIYKNLKDARQDGLPDRTGLDGGDGGSRGPLLGCADPAELSELPDWYGEDAGGDCAGLRDSEEGGGAGQPQAGEAGR